MLPTAILFDLDDTLTHRKAAVATYARFLLADLAANLPDGTFQAVHGALVASDDYGSIKQADALVLALPWRGAVSPDRLYEHWHARFGEAATFFPGTERVLQGIAGKGVRMGLVTNGASSMQRSKIAALGLDRYISAILISEEVGIEKPEAAIFHKALDGLGCDASEAWFVGDHPETDFLGAEKAGLRGYWVRTGPNVPVGKPPSRQLKSLTELLDHI